MAGLNGNSFNFSLVDTVLENFTSFHGATTRGSALIPDIAEEIYYPVSVILSFFGNFFVIMTIWRRAPLHKPSFFLVLNLAVGDLASSFVICVFGIPNIYSKRWVYGNAVCQFQGFMMQMLAFQMLLSLLWTAVDRFIAICKALRYTELVTNRRCFMMIIHTWVHSAFVCLPPFFNWGTYENDVISYSCMMKWAPELKHRTFNLFTGLTTVFPSGLIITYCYFKVLREARKVYSHRNATEPAELTNISRSANKDCGIQRGRKINQIGGKINNSKEINAKSIPATERKQNSQNEIDVKCEMDEVTSSCAEGVPNAENTGKEKRKQNRVVVFKREFRALAVGFIVTVTFVITWSPFVIVRMMKLYLPEEFQTKQSMLKAEKFTLILFTAAAFINPMIYAILRKQFREEFLKLLKTMRKLFVKN